MSTFADSSALVKLYSDESWHTETRALTDLVVSQIARVEVPAAIWRKQRMGEISAEDAGVLSAAFAADWFGTMDDPPRFAAVALVAPILEDAIRMCTVHGLRAYDAVQLASARAAAAADESCRHFAAFDQDLRAAATAEGFVAVPGMTKPAG